MEQPEIIEPKVFCDETQWKENFPEPEQFDLIVSNMKLHWVNDVETTLKNYHDSLEPDGVFMSTSLGGDSL